MAVKNIQFAPDKVDFSITQGLGIKINFTLYNEDGSDFLAPSAMIMGFKSYEDVELTSVSSADDEITITQNSDDVDVEIVISEDKSALLPVGTHIYTIAMEVDGMYTLCFEGKLDVNKSAIPTS